MHHPFSGETYTALPDGTVEVQSRHGDVGIVKLTEDGASYEIVSGKAPRVALHLIQWALAEERPS